MSTNNRFPILGDLDAEWRDFVHGPAAAEAVERWRRNDPVLAELETVEDVLTLRRDEARADLVLRALVDRAPTDPVAARVVLQSILPGLVRIACWYADDDPEAAAGEVMAIAWERICAYPAHRAGEVAPNLLLDVRKQMRLDREPLGTSAPVPPLRSAEEVVLEGLLFEEQRASPASSEEEVSTSAGCVHPQRPATSTHGHWRWGTGGTRAFAALPLIRRRQAVPGPPCPGNRERRARSTLVGRQRQHRQGCLRADAVGNGGPLPQIGSARYGPEQVPVLWDNGSGACSDSQVAQR
ncbi:MAG: hypothetical protein U5K30_16875 [Acidimicrobiales bacterium]|nr:hypothetical protein [Acidimicrobiales bacterium]